MAKFDEESVNKFITNLEGVDESWQTEFSLKEVIIKAYPLIKKARKYKVSWEQIAQTLEESCAEKIQISPVTMRQYFLELSKDLKVTKKSSKKSKKRIDNIKIEAVKKDINTNSGSISKDEADDSLENQNQEVKPQKKERIVPSSFNLRGD